MNPFPINTYLGPEYFCNRENETAVLIKNIKNQSNTVFFAQRRVGKTSLVKHVFYRIENTSYETIFIDIFSTEKLLDFTNILAGAIYKKFPLQHSIGSKFWESIKLLRPVITINEFNGSPELSFDINNPQTIEKTIPQIFEFLDTQEKHVIIAIDEFQQILKYPEKNVEAILRTVIQNLKNVNFIFLGSNRKMISEIFNNSKKPFFESAINLRLHKIKDVDYFVFIESLFKNDNIKIDEDAIMEILKITKTHTYYTQLLCHEIYAENKKHIDTNDVYRVLEKIITANEGVYFQYRNLLSKPQWKLLTAVAKAEVVHKPYSKDFIKKYSLEAASSVKRSLEALNEKELIYQEIDSEQSHYEVQDKFLMKWLQYKY